MARAQLPENEQIWVWDNYAQELYLTEIGEFSRNFDKENDPQKYYVITIDPKTEEIRLKRVTSATEHMKSRDLVTLHTVLGQKLTCTTDSKMMAYETKDNTHEDGSARIVGATDTLATASPETTDCVLSPRCSSIFANHLLSEDDKLYAYLIASYVLYGEQIAANHVRFENKPGFDPVQFKKAMERVSGKDVREPGKELSESKKTMSYVFELPAPYASNILGAFGTTAKNRSLQPNKLIFPIHMYQKMSLSSPYFMYFLMEAIRDMDKKPVFHNRLICRQLLLCNLLYGTGLTPKVTTRVNDLDEVEYVVSYDDANARDWISEDVTDWVQKVRVTNRSYGNSRYLSTYEITVENSDNFLTADCLFVQSE